LSRREIVREPLLGWRAWLVVETRDGPALASWCMSALWPARRALQARCERHGSRPVTHHVCGIHAFNARAEALAYVESTHDMPPRLFARRPHQALGIAFGRASGWGRAVAHTRGWRSEFAYPFDLQLLKGDRTLARALAGRYGVEVLPLPTDT
jgi:hypothetical protein